MKIILRTFGGFGNQLFQYFFSFNLASYKKINSIYSTHDKNYPHKFTLENSLDIFKKPSDMENFVSNLRIPMALNRLGIMKKGYLNIGKVYFIDGYFQDLNNYADFSEDHLSHSMHHLKSILNIQKAKPEKFCVNHLRLGDFFTSESLQREYIENKISNLEPDSHIITNRQDLFKERKIEDILQNLNISLINTENDSPKDLIERMSKYKIIKSNDSTLAFWAALLQKRDLEVKSENLKMIYDVLKEI